MHALSSSCFFFNCMSARFVGWKSRYIIIQIIIWQGSPGVIPSVSIGSCDFCRDFVIRKVSTETVITVFLRESRQIQNKQVLSECHVLDYLLTSFSRGVLQRRQPNIPQYDHSARFVKSYHFQFYILTNSFFRYYTLPQAHERSIHPRFVVFPRCGSLTVYFSLEFSRNVDVNEVLSVLNNAAVPGVKSFGDFVVDPESIRVITDDEIPTELPTGTNKEPTGTCTRLFMEMRYILFVKLIAV